LPSCPWPARPRAPSPLYEDLQACVFWVRVVWPNLKVGLQLGLVEYVRGSSLPNAIPRRLVGLPSTWCAWHLPPRTRALQPERRRGLCHFFCSSWGAAGQVSAGCTASRTQVGSLLPRKAGSLNHCLVLAQHCYWYWPPPPQRRRADASCLLGRAQTCERSTAISSGIQMLPPPHAKLLQAKTIVAANCKKATRESTGRGAGPPTYAQRGGRPGEVGLQCDQHL